MSVERSALNRDLYYPSEGGSRSMVDHRDEGLESREECYSDGLLGSEHLWFTTVGPLNIPS